MLDELYTLLYQYKDLSLLPNTFKNRLLLRAVRRKAKRFAKKFAKTQAKKVYNKSLELCEQIIKANF